MKNALAEIKYMNFKPGELTPEQWQEVVDAWANGLSDREAAFRVCRNTGKVVTESQLKKIVLNNEDALWLRDCLHDAILTQAKLNIRKSIDSGSVSTAKWYLERKAPEEFSSKAAVAFEGAVTEISMEDKKRQMDAFMEQFDKQKEDHSVLKVGEFPDE